VRVIGEITPERLETLRAADAIVRQEIEAAGLGREIWQYFAVLTSVRSVGVMGDARTYSNVAAIRAVTSEDGMTADWARIPYDVLARISNRIVNQCPALTAWSMTFPANRRRRLSGNNRGRPRPIPLPSGEDRVRSCLVLSPSRRGEGAYGN
jgi:hypothetical protein